jgi:DNA polymerase I
VPIRLDLSACQTQDYDRDQVIALFQDLAFRSLVEKLPPSTPRPAIALPLDPRATEEGEPAPASAEAEQMALFEMTPDLMAQPASVTPSDAAGVSDVLMVVTPAALAEVAEQLASNRQFAFDTETTGTDPYSADLVGVSVAWGPSMGQAAYIPLRHFDTPGLAWETVAAALQPAFASPDIEKIAHNISYDLGILNRAGLRVESPIVDTPWSRPG